MNFIGGQDRLDNRDIANIAQEFGLDYADVKALIEVETGTGKGFTSDNRPIILYERHKFYENLQKNYPEALARAVRQGLATKRWKQLPYPKTIAGSYDLLKQAMEISQEQALRSCSWGMGQIMGSNHEEAGYSLVYDMVQAFIRSEDEQLRAMCRLLVSWKIDDDLKAGRYEVVARRWNGPKFKENRYHLKLAEAVAKWRRIGPPRTLPQAAPTQNGDRGWKVKAVQERLDVLGYRVKVDGIFGTRTRDAVLAFQADNALQLTGALDEEFMTKLDEGRIRPTSETRKSTNVEDLRGESRIVDTSDQAKKLAAGLVATEVVTEGTKVLPSPYGFLSGYVDLLEPLVKVRDFLGDSKMIIYVAAGFFAWYLLTKVQQYRAEDTRTGKTV